jgi:hypothetical protein
VVSQPDQTEHTIQLGLHLKAVFPPVTIPDDYIVRAFEQTMERKSIIVPLEIDGVRYETTVVFHVTVKKPITEATCE